MTEIQYRTATLELETRAGSESVMATLSTDAPVQMPYGMEVLSHDPAAVNLSRAKKGLPLLWQHSPNEIIGRVDAIRLENGKLRGELRAGNSQRAKELWQDVHAGIIRDVSIGYSIDQAPVRQGDVFLVPRWTIYETSLVSMGADTLAGVGRSLNQKKSGGNTMIETNEHEQPEDGWKKDKYDERQRVAEILSIGKAHNCIELAQRYIQEGRPLDAFKSEVLKAIYRAEPIDTSGYIGISEREAGKFSFTRALRAMMTNNREEAPFEFEASRAVEQRLGKKVQGVFVPGEVLQRGLTKGTAADGGYTVATDLLAASFIDTLRNQTQVINLGAMMLSGLVGDVAIPKQTGAATGYWVSEGSDITASQQTFGQVALSPKTLGARTQFTRKLLLQSTPAIEEIIRNDLARVLSIELDRAAINGSGTNNQPKGILSTTGIGDVPIGTDGGAPTWGHIVDLVAQVEQFNVNGNGFLTNAKVKAKLSKTFTNATYGDEPVWQPGTNGGWTLAGYPALVSGNVPSNLTKGASSGVCSAIIFGNWQDLIIGQWGALDLLLDPYTLAASGGMQVRAMLELDIAVRHAESFAAIKDALTT